MHITAQQSNSGLDSVHRLDFTIRARFKTSHCATKRAAVWDYALTIYLHGAVLIGRETIFLISNQNSISKGLFVRSRLAGTGYKVG